jgi:hypothetical protein
MPRPTGPRRNPSVLRAPTVVNGADSTYRPIAGHVVADVLSGADRGVASLRQHLEARRAGAGDSDQLDPHYPALAEKPLTAIHWSLAVSMGNVQVSANSVPSDLPSDSAPPSRTRACSAVGRQRFGRWPPPARGRRRCWPDRRGHRRAAGPRVRRRGGDVRHGRGDSARRWPASAGRRAASRRRRSRIQSSVRLSGPRRPWCWWPAPTGQKPVSKVRRHRRLERHAEFVAACPARDSTALSKGMTRRPRPDRFSSTRDPDVGSSRGRGTPVRGSVRGDDGAPRGTAGRHARRGGPAGPSGSGVVPTDGATASSAIGGAVWPLQ